MEIQRPKSRQPIPENAKKVFSGIVFDVYQWEQEMFDGTKATFEKLKRRDTVVVFPVLPDGRILLTKQEHPGKKPFIGATGGGREEGEDIISAAKRELLEESGYEAQEFILWDCEQPISKLDWSVYVFVAKGFKKVGEITPDPGEKISLLPVTFEELMNLATDENQNFAEKEVVVKFFEARLNAQKRKELETLFKP